MAFTYDLTTDPGRVRLLLNDVESSTAVFNDEEIEAFLALEGGSVKLAAAQAIDTNADNEVLASKVLRTQDLQTDGAKLSEALRARAKALRAQHEAETDSEDEGFFEVISGTSDSPELTHGWL